ncbi:hypersensitive-induced reaction 1 protein-like [Syzygium oleosum]|uniref:hypersensitive-induced reaction 1 protein-like n=1 Tax=Syzygium oleosum TaxID=219896 RepID=UPI0024B9CE62|nr:hypersensitive-induced reaction 1 protein-like [Syzygium oleosum]
MNSISDPGVEQTMFVFSVVDYMGIKEMAMLLIGIHLYKYKMGNMCCYVQVEERTVAITKRFGRTKTKDNDFVNVIAHVQYRVHQERQYEAFYMQRNPRRQIQGYVLKVIGAMVAVRNMDEVSGQRDEIAKAIMEEMKEPVGLNGYEILQVQIWDVSLDKGLEQAMIEAKNAKRKAEVERHDGQEVSTSAAM